MDDSPPTVTQSITPMLSYDDAPAAIEFLCRAFGFQESYRLDMPDGKIGHAELTLNGNVLMLATTWKAAGMASPRDLSGVHSQLNCTVDDVDVHFERARAAGAILSTEPEDQFHGARMYRAVDPEGHRWIFSSPVRPIVSGDT